MGMWRVTLMDGSITHIDAEEVEIHQNGALEFSNVGNKLVFAFAPGIWKYYSVRWMNEGRVR